MRQRAWTTDAVAAAVLVVVGLLYGQQAWVEGIGSPSDTGAGFFPAIVAVVLVASGAWVVVQEVRSPGAPVAADEDDADFQGDVHWWRIAGVLLASLAVPLLAERIGFVVAVSASVVVIARLMGMAGWLRPLVLGAAFGAAVWFVFVYWLFVPLPAGQLGLG